MRVERIKGTAYKDKDISASIISNSVTITEALVIVET